MKIGVCTGMNPERIRIAREIGYDFVEGHCQDLVKASEEQLAEIESIGIPMLTANCFIGLPIIPERRDDGAVRGYLDTLFSRAERLGLRCLVFGSGGARRLPENYTHAQGYEAIAAFLREFVLPLAQQTGICIAIEPLRSKECNAINTVAEGLTVASLVDAPEIGVLADVFHMISMGEPLEALADYKGALFHAHTSDPTPEPSLGVHRAYPRLGNAFDQASFLLPLEKAGVETCAIEADVVDFEADARAGFEALRGFRTGECR